MQEREVTGLGTDGTLHDANGRRPSQTTRASSLFTPPAEPPAHAVVDCTRHRLLPALALVDRSKPFLIRLSDAAADSAALRHTWDRHVRTCELSYKAATQHVEGTRKTLHQAWDEDGLAIQHDLDDEACSSNPVVDFLRAHPELKLSGMWSRLEEWLEAHIGPIVRRPAFINGSQVRPTTTHYDDYTSVAVVLAGAKTFYVAAPKLVHQTGRGMLHESSASPHKPGTSREQAVPQPFVRMQVDAGSILCLPRGWWHYVESQPRTVMVCAWI